MRRAGKVEQGSQPVGILAEEDIPAVHTPVEGSLEEDNRTMVLEGKAGKEQPPRSEVQGCPSGTCAAEEVAAWAGHRTYHRVCPTLFCAESDQTTGHSTEKYGSLVRDKLVKQRTERGVYTFYLHACTNSAHEYTSVS